MVSTFHQRQTAFLTNLTTGKFPNGLDGYLGVLYQWKGEKENIRSGTARV